MSTVQLSNATVEIIDHLTWGQQQQIQAAMLSGMRVGGASKDIDINAEALLSAKYKSLELAIVKITEGDMEKPYSREWVDALSIEDGDTLYEAVNAVTNPEKKS